VKRLHAIVTDAAAEALVTWAHSLNPRGPRPSLDEAATVALDEWSRERRELRDEFIEAARRVDEGKGKKGNGSDGA
jgi:hypothetical protein